MKRKISKLWLIVLFLVIFIFFGLATYYFIYNCDDLEECFNKNDLNCNFDDGPDFCENSLKRTKCLCNKCRLCLTKEDRAICDLTDTELSEFC